MISIGAPLEIRAAPKSAQRIYITDTEVNHIAHKLARSRATDIVIPNHFRDDLSGPLLRTKAQIHRIEGLHGHVHLRPSLRPRGTNSPPRILLRRLKGDGIHDRNEIKIIDEDWLSSFDITLADEGEFSGDPWSLDSLIACRMASSEQIGCDTSVCRTVISFLLAVTWPLLAAVTR